MSPLGNFIVLFSELMDRLTNIQMAHRLGHLSEKDAVDAIDSAVANYQHRMRGTHVDG